jgi:hypothetical protein
MHAAKHMAINGSSSDHLSDIERAALMKFYSRVNEVFERIPWNDPTVTIEDIVVNNAAMKEIREVASESLRAIGANVDSDELSYD